MVCRVEEFKVQCFECAPLKDPKFLLQYKCVLFVLICSMCAQPTVKAIQIILVPHQVDLRMAIL